MWAPLFRSIHIGMVAWLLWPFLGRAQADLDSLDVWVRRMHPAPFMRCMPSDWESKLNALKVGWEDMTHMEHVREVNACFKTCKTATLLCRRGIGCGASSESMEAFPFAGPSKATGFGWPNPQSTACPRAPASSR